MAATTTVWVSTGPGQAQAISSEHLGVVALGIASEHSAAGSAQAMIYVHLRDERLEREVAQLSGSKDAGYKATTAVTSLGYLMPESHWREWSVDQTNAAAVASEMVAAVETFAVPYLQRLSIDSAALLSAVEASPSYAIATGLCRAALVLANAGLVDEARSLVAHREAGLVGRTDDAAEAERRMVERLRQRLTPPVQD